MKLSLEQLKAMSDEELEVHWSRSEFPLEKLNCGTCLTEHGSLPCPIEGHEAVTEAVTAMRYWYCRRPKGAELRPHLEELYALRLFFDSLYPESKRITPADLPKPAPAPPAEQEMEAPVEQI